MPVAVVDPRSLKDNPDKARRSKSSPQADALMAATIKAVGVVQAPIVFAEPGGGNVLVIESGHRRRDGAIAADLAEIEVLIVEAANDNGGMRNLVENLARDNLLGSVSRLSCWIRTAVMVVGDIRGAYRGRHTDVRVKRSRSVARTTLEAAATPQAF